MTIRDNSLSADMRCQLLTLKLTTLFRITQSAFDFSLVIVSKRFLLSFSFDRFVRFRGLLVKNVRTSFYVMRSRIGIISFCNVKGIRDKRTNLVKCREHQTNICPFISSPLQCNVIDKNLKGILRHAQKL